MCISCSYLCLLAVHVQPQSRPPSFRFLREKQKQLRRSSTAWYTSCLRMATSEDRRPRTLCASTLSHAECQEAQSTRCQKHMTQINIDKGARNLATSNRHSRLLPYVRFASSFYDRHGAEVLVSDQMLLTTPHICVYVTWP
jgi:hypothetical protein